MPPEAVTLGITRLESALRTPQAAGPRLLSAWRYAGFWSRAIAIASASDNEAGTDCCAPATAGPSRSPALSSTCFMGILESFRSRGRTLYAQASDGVSACDTY